MKTVQAEIEYFDSKKNHWIHSDIEPKGCSSETLKDVEYRKFLHDCLDEWLDNSNGSGTFYIEEENYQRI